MPELVRVLIPTTEHLIEVTWLVRQKRSIQAVIDDTTQDRTRKPLPITPMYVEFVRGGSGFIEELYGHANFVLHLSGRIDEGASWQLGAFVAHALENASRLASTNENSETIVWVTGALKRQPKQPTLNVTSVGELQKKLKLSLKRLGEERAKGHRVIVAWPRADDRDVSQGTRQTLQELGIEILGPTPETGSGGDSSIESGIEHVAELFEELDLDVPTWPLVTAAAASKKLERPFRGLDVFEETDRDEFLGRGRARATALEQMRDAADLGCAFLLVHGASGVGKSSFARAGLIPAIKDRDRDTIWRTAVMVVGRGGVPPVQGLCEALTKVGLSANGLEQKIRSEPATAPSLIVEVLAEAKLILLVDQLEELPGWREQDDLQGVQYESEGEAFGEILEGLARSGKAWVIATIRAEYVDRLLTDFNAFARLASASPHLYLLQTPTKAELREIIIGTGVNFEGEDENGKPFKEVLVEAATTAPESLPLLQVALEEFYELEGKTGTIRYLAYKEWKGGIEGAIGNWARRKVEARVGIADPEKRLDAQALDDLILELGRYDRISNSVVPREFVVDEKSSDPARQKVLKVLEDARLVVVDVSPSETSARVAHASVLTHWPRASQLFESRQAAIALRDRLEYEAKDWEDKKQHHELLIPDGARLREALDLLVADLLAVGRVRVSQLVKKYIEASNDYAQRQRDADRSRQAALIEAQTRTIKWIKTLSAAMALVLLGTIFQLARNNYVVSGGRSFLSPGVSIYWQQQYDKLKSEDDNEKSTTLNNLLTLLADARKHAISASEIEAILPLSVPQKYKVLFLLAADRAPTPSDVAAVLALSPSELDAAVKAKTEKSPESVIGFVKTQDVADLNDVLGSLLSDHEFDAVFLLAFSNGSWTPSEVERVLALPPHELERELKAKADTESNAELVARLKVFEESRLQSLPIPPSTAGNLWTEVKWIGMQSSLVDLIDGLLKSSGSISLPDIEEILPLRPSEKYKVLFLLPEVPTYSEFERVLALSSSELDAEVKAKANAESEGSWEAIFGQALLLPVPQDLAHTLWIEANARSAAANRNSVGLSDIEAILPFSLSEKYMVLFLLPEAPAFSDFRRVLALSPSELEVEVEAKNAASLPNALLPRTVVPVK